MTAEDRELLERYARDGSEEAFTTLVQRHVNLVYSAALRQVRAPQLAEEVAQSVFTDLSRNLTRLKPGTILTAWLYQVTRRTAIDVVRREARRQARERVAVEITAMNATAAEWTHIEPLLDEAMDALDDTDRAAVLLRYFENKSLREVGAALGTSDDAAQKRVSRAVERLREFFAQRSVTVGAGGLVVVLSANAVQAAPVGLAVAVSTAALAGSTLVTTATATATTAIAMTTLQKAIIAVTVTVLAGAGIYEARQASQLREQVASVRAEHAPLTEQFALLQRERDEAARQLARSRAEIADLKRDLADLPRLRGEVTRLGDDARELARLKAMGKAGDGRTETEMRSWLNRVSQLRQHLDQSPSAKIPELHFLTERDWLDASKDGLETERDYRKAGSALRGIAEGEFANMLKDALSEFQQVEGKDFPSELAQLKPYLEPHVASAVLDQAFARYAIFPSNHVPNVQVDGRWAISQVSPVDAEFDQRFVIGPTDVASSSGGAVWSSDAK